MTTTLFKEEVLEGLMKPLKTLPSKYFYDAKGDALFQQIMRMPSYYLPKCEREILTAQSHQILDAVTNASEKINVIELGAGDGSKTVQLLEVAVKKNSIDTFIPLDISSNVLAENKKNITAVLPNLTVEPIAGDFFKTLDTLSTHDQKKLILFMGSNIGNFSTEKAINFLSLVGEKMLESDCLLVAFDLKKNPKKILEAYNDVDGITKAFNLNVLHRINRELDTKIDVTKFDHYPTYDPVSGITKSFLVSLEEQSILIDDQVIRFKKEEVIHTEISKKYNLSEIEDLISRANMKVLRHFMDKNEHYTLSLIKKQ